MLAAPRRSNSVPAVDRASRGPPGPSQARLLQGRGDLQQGRATFQTQLGKPSPLARPLRDGSPITRLGMDVICPAGSERARLHVADVDRHPAKKTPVAEWNFKERRLAVRGEGERHASLAILPGDRIRAVSASPAISTEGQEATMSASAMLKELEAATDAHNPRALSLAVSRDISDVLRPPGSAPAGTVSSRASSRMHSDAALCTVASAASSPSMGGQQTRLRPATTAAATPPRPPRLRPAAGSNDAGRRTPSAQALSTDGWGGAPNRRRTASCPRIPHSASVSSG
eukprot:TRINITY_DN10311_c0_g1_i1.p1 TRINITY_DN10311_c0_g1~~TRINITY_DN10311_c0_g1_i1.p1  ORF type:complete len:286 (+),score=39.52 TRINITY_DN10311_c0_g1_i1:55-912(+)